MNNEDLVAITAAKLKMPKELVQKVVTDFWGSVRLSLRDPEKNYTGLVLGKFLRFYLKPYTLAGKIRKVLERKNYSYAEFLTGLFRKVLYSLRVTNSRREYYIKYLEDYERQTREGIHNERHDSGISE
jgi:hypothetical protein